MLAIGAPEGRHKRFPPKRASVKNVYPVFREGKAKSFGPPIPCN